MLLMGDEVRRTQGGNNNAFCQDKETAWFSWGNLETHADLLRFTRSLIAWRQGCNLFHQDTFWSEPGGPEAVWHGVKLGQPDWGADSHSLAFELADPASGEHLHVMLNAYWQALEFEIPPAGPDKAWWRLIDTALPSPSDFADPPVRLKKGQRHYTAQPRSAVVLIAVKS